MKKLKKTFGEDLEQFEIAKLRKKYEDLGYRFFEEHRIKREKQSFLFDAYAKHPETKDEIIFEVKSTDSLQKGDTEKILNQRNKYLRSFPHARFVLVLAKEDKKPIIDYSNLNDLILEFINVKYFNFLKTKIPTLIKLERVESITFVKVEFGDFNKMHLNGYANLIFWISLLDITIIGDSLSDGLPFQFHTYLNHTHHSDSSIYTLDNNTVVIFDLGEFEL